VPGPVRPRRTVAVTGAAAGAGAAVLARLRESPRIGTAIGVDAAPGPGDWRRTDLLDPGLTGVFGGVDAVAHLAVDLAPDADRAGQRLRNTRAAQTVLTAAFAAGSSAIDCTYFCVR